MTSGDIGGRLTIVSNYALKHILIDCVDVTNIRSSFYNVNILSSLLTNVAGDTLLKVLKERYN
jgi:hypothetical protein